VAEVFDILLRLATADILGACIGSRAQQSKCPCSICCKAAHFVIVTDTGFDYALARWP